MRLLRALLVIGMGSISGNPLLPQIKSEQPEVQNCKQLVGTHSGIGSAYRGIVSNSDYNFSARVPTNLTGWSGVADAAPFHGFTIFLDSKEQSCIDFEIHIRIDESKSVARPQKARYLSLGSARGWQTDNTGMIDGNKLRNVKTVFSFRQPDQIDDGMIILVAPAAKATSALRAYDEFLQSLVFGH